MAVGQHDVGPAGAGVDALCEVVHPRPCLGPAGVPQGMGKGFLVGIVADLALGFDGRFANAADPEVELRRQPIALTVQLARFDEASPGRELLSGGWLRDVEGHRGPHTGGTPVPNEHDERRGETFNELGHRGIPPRILAVGFESVAVQDEDRPAQRGLAFAEPDHASTSRGSTGSDSARIVARWIPR